MGGGLSSYVVGRVTCAACHAKPAARGRSHDRQAEMTHLLQARNDLVFKPWVWVVKLAGVRIGVISPVLRSWSTAQKPA